jgi:hypothetical protein
MHFYIYIYIYIYTHTLKKLLSIQVEFWDLQEFWGLLSQR